MPFQKIKQNTDILTRMLAIIAVIIAALTVIQAISEFQATKKKASEFSQVLEILSQQNQRSIDDRKILHDQNEQSIRERRELNKRLDALEKEK